MKEAVRIPIGNVAVGAPVERNDLRQHLCDNLGANAFVRIELSRDNGSSWEVIADSVNNTAATSGTFAWTVTRGSKH